MLNKEKYAKEISEIACSGHCIGMMNGTLCPCNTIKHCEDCDFYDRKSKTSCAELIKNWANSEYKEREIDWNKVPVDTPVYVWNGNDYDGKLPRHFAGFRNISNSGICAIAAFNKGLTSWTTDKNDVIYWEHAEIKEGIDCSQWYKD